MTRYFVQAHVKPGKKSEFAAHLKGGSLAQGQPFHDALLEAMRTGRGTLDEAYLTVDVPREQLDDVREVLDAYFEVDRVVPEGQVEDHVLRDLQSYDRLPDWAGVDRD